MKQFVKEGICIGYKSLKSKVKQISNQLCSKYHQDGIICPPSLQTDLFTSAAIDNIDHDLSPATAKSSFHGTSISIFQHTTVPIEEILDTSINTSHMLLRSNYTDIKSTHRGKAEPLPCLSFDIPSEKSISEDAKAWIRSIKNRKSFSAYHSKLSTNTNLCKTISELMPLLQESVNSAAMVRHCMDLIIELTKKLNPVQISSVITGDQPVYALGKQVQWMYQDEFADVVWMMGPLHIETAHINMNGDWLEGSGWIDIFKHAR